jgi:hypothetical protein
MMAPPQRLVFDCISLTQVRSNIEPNTASIPAAQTRSFDKTVTAVLCSGKSVLSAKENIDNGRGGVHVERGGLRG